MADLREGAERVLAVCDLSQVYLASSHSQTHNHFVDPPFSTDTSVAVRGHQTAGRVEAWAQYVTEASKLEDGSEAPIPVWTVMVECVAVFDAAVDIPDFSDDDLEAFAVVMGAPTIHPYAREATQSLSGRSPYPAFTLGLLTPVLAMPDDFQVDFPDRDVDSE